MKIKVNEIKFAEINVALEKVNGKAVSHTASYNEIAIMATLAEDRLDALGVPKKDRKGARISGMSGGGVPSAYKYSRAVNRIQLERGASDWFLITLTRIDIWGSASSPTLALLPAQRDLALAKFSKQFVVIGV